MTTIPFYTSDNKQFFTSDDKEFHVPIFAADTIYFDSIGLADATITDGYVSGGNFNVASDNTGLENLVDQHLSAPCLFGGSTQSGVRFSLAAQKDIDFFACYYPFEGYDHVIKLYGSNSAASGYSLITTAVASRQGWVITDFTQVTYQYLVLQVERHTIDLKISELIIGEAWNPSEIFDAGWILNDEPLVIINLADSGVEYAVKKATPKTGWNYILTGIGDTFKAELELFRSGLEKIRKKFIYHFDDYDLNYVKLTKASLRFINDSGRYKTRFHMKKQEA